MPARKGEMGCAVIEGHETCWVDTRALLPSVQVHHGWQKHVVIAFVSIGYSDLILTLAVIDLMQWRE